MKKVLFQEEQKFSLYWIQIPLLVIAVISLSQIVQGFIKQVVRGIPWGSRPMSDTGLILLLLFMLAIWLSIYLLFYLSKLKTTISQDAIEVRFPPFFSKPKLFKPDMIKVWELRKYSPLLEYGGWGIRYGRKGKAYNVSGNIGLQLVFQNGKKLLIGTKKKDQVQWAMEKLMGKNN